MGQSGIEPSAEQRGIERPLSNLFEDEGTGLANPEPGVPAPRDSRGIGLRLALARALMLAHGGHLEVEAAAQVGTRVRLCFPAAQVRNVQGLPVAAGEPALGG